MRDRVGAKRDVRIIISLPEGNLKSKSCRLKRARISKELGNICVFFGACTECCHLGKLCSHVNFSELVCAGKRHVCLNHNEHAKICWGREAETVDKSFIWNNSF